MSSIGIKGTPPELAVVVPPSWAWVEDEEKLVRTPRWCRTDRYEGAHIVRCGTNTNADALEWLMLTADDESTLDLAVARWTRMYDQSGRRDLRGERLADGWIVTFAGGEHGDAFIVDAHREIAGIVIDCYVETTTRAAQQEAADACKSLRGRAPGD